MASPQQSQIFDIDLDELTAIRHSVGATEKEMRLAYNRALARTAVTVHKLAAKLMRDELKAKNLKLIRARLKKFRLKKGGKALDELKLWFGLNPVPVHALRGRLRSTKDSGATFTPTSPRLSRVHEARGFVIEKNGQKMMFRRTSAKRYEMVKVEIDDALHVRIEDEIFEQIPEIFVRHFTTDIKGRIALRPKK
ncbi:MULTISPECIES: hypothetical protein [unclassified Vibrio]|uniref:hypothetical protein n=1 Tax=unclassified Vibrio TaxID=2614977 RepID=UPI001361970C|nr:MULTISPECIES: hypothetical protein [unclassified Vibrio]NAW56996.1 hypothetical protein [Vibrio sp. V36_P2S2PM302]NAX27634.1 hypothetical protein [Vibrio sp. V38_P2S17PM301]NAX29396.1 hypothetical protein [Vibrio sp. V37_P2S8PM304]